MASVTAVTASPTTIAPHGGVSTVTPTITNSGQTVTVTVYDDQGGSGTANITISPETLTFTTVAANKGVQGYIYGVASSTTAGTLAVAANGTSFTFTAA